MWFILVSSSGSGQRKRIVKLEIKYSTRLSFAKERNQIGFDCLDSTCSNSARLSVAAVELMSEKGRPLPKFGEWDVNDPASAEGFTVIFNKARDEKKTGGKPESPERADSNYKHGVDTPKPQTKKWLCCMQSPRTE